MCSFWKRIRPPLLVRRAMNEPGYVANGVSAMSEGNAIELAILTMREGAHINPLPEVTEIPLIRASQLLATTSHIQQRRVLGRPWTRVGVRTLRAEAGGVNDDLAMSERRTNRCQHRSGVGTGREGFEYLAPGFKHGLVALLRAGVDDKQRAAARPPQLVQHLPCAVSACQLAFVEHHLTWRRWLSGISRSTNAATTTGNCR